MREIEFKAYWADTKEEVIDFSAEYLIEDCNSDNFIVCQYTGLKDKNGTKIFEGDIVADYKGKNSYEISFKRGAFMWGDDDFFGWNVTEDLELQEDDLRKCEVVGNIHE